MRERISSMNSYQPALSKVVKLISMKEIMLTKTLSEFFIFDKKREEFL